MTGSRSVQRWGVTGPGVVLVHGAVLAGRPTWRPVRPLGSKWRLVVPTRRGYAPGPPLADGVREDPAVDAQDIRHLVDSVGTAPAAALPAATAPPTQGPDAPGGPVETGVHLVGHSFGAVVAMLAAALPGVGLDSLVLIEPPPPPATHTCPEVREWIRDLEELFSDDASDATGWFARFAAQVGVDSAPGAAGLPAELVRHVGMARRAKPAHLVSPPVEQIAGTVLRVHVVSGGHSGAFETGCDELARALNGTRHVVPGAGHNVPWAPGFADALENILRSD